MVQKWKKDVLTLNEEGIALLFTEVIKIPVKKYFCSMCILYPCISVTKISKSALCKLVRSSLSGSQLEFLMFSD